MNIGSGEFLIIAGLALLLFGPSLIAFWLGYVFGQRKREESEGLAATESPEPPRPAAEPDEPEAPSDSKDEESSPDD